jgi:hypothetical protein
MSGSPLVLRLRKRTGERLRLSSWWAPSSPRGKRTTSPSAKSRHAWGVRRLGVPSSTIRTSSSA